MNNITVIFILAVSICVIAYDFYALKRGGEEATISVVLYRAALTRPIIPFAFGVLMGHFFWPVN